MWMLLPLLLASSRAKERYALSEPPPPPAPLPEPMTVPLVQFPLHLYSWYGRSPWRRMHYRLKGRPFITYDRLYAELHQEKLRREEAARLKLAAEQAEAANRRAREKRKVAELDRKARRKTRNYGL